MSQPPAIVILGRPNVGKSTLFNRLVGRKRNLVLNEPGVTRDRIESNASWDILGGQAQVTVVDTGGLLGDRFTQEIEKHVRLALEGASAAVFVVDSVSGLIPADHEIWRMLKCSPLASRIPWIVAANKIDDFMHEDRMNEFYELGADRVLPVSAEHGRGIEDLKMALLEAIKKTSIETPCQINSGPRVAIVGKPNVGKSSLLNRIAGEDRVITSPVAGTTIDSIDLPVKMGDAPFIFVDTAGIRRKSKTERGVEVLSVIQAKKALERCDIALLVVDGESGVTDQDEKIAGLIEDSGSSVIILVNKWDTQKHTGFSKDQAKEHIQAAMGFLKYAPILFVSALMGTGLSELPELITKVLEARKVKIPTKALTEWAREVVKARNPRDAKVYLCHQTNGKRPTFKCHVNDPRRIHFSLKRQLVNSIREQWGYEGTPVHMLFSKSARN